MKILMVRHGEPDYSIDSLTPKGWREAEILAGRMAKIQDPDVYCSPLGRAQDTARATLQKTGWSMETLPWLAEYRGEVWHEETGRMDIPWDFPPLFWTTEKRFFSLEHWCEPPIFAGTDVAAVWEETKQGLDALLARYGYSRDGMIYRCEKNLDKTLLLFCHFGISAAMCAYLLGVSPILLWHGWIMAPTSVTTLVTEERTPGQVFFRCNGFGDVSHLYAAGEPVSPAGVFPELYTQQNGGRVYEHMPEDL